MGKQGCGVAQANAGEFKYKSQRANGLATLAALFGLNFNGVPRDKPDGQSSVLEDFFTKQKLFIFAFLNVENLVSFVERLLAEAIGDRRIINFALQA